MRLPTLVACCIFESPHIVSYVWYFSLRSVSVFDWTRFCCPGCWCSISGSTLAYLNLMISNSCSRHFRRLVRLLLKAEPRRVIIQPHKDVVSCTCACKCICGSSSSSAVHDLFLPYLRSGYNTACEWPFVDSHKCSTMPEIKIDIFDFSCCFFVYS